MNSKGFPIDSFSSKFNNQCISICCTFFRNRKRLNVGSYIFIVHTGFEEKTRAQISWTYFSWSVPQQTFHLINKKRSDSLGERNGWCFLTVSVTFVANFRLIFFLVGMDMFFVYFNSFYSLLDSSRYREYVIFLEKDLKLSRAILVVNQVRKDKRRSLMSSLKPPFFMGSLLMSVRTKSTMARHLE